MFCVFFSTLLGIQSTINSPPASSIHGNYYCYIAFLHDDLRTTLKIKADQRYEELMVSRGNNNSKRKSKRTGTWTLKGDTIILTPTTYRLSSKEELDCLAADNGHLLCAADTFIFKDSALWTIKKPVYKAFSRKKPF